MSSQISDETIDSENIPLSQLSSASSKSSGFRKYPELANIFDRGTYTGKRQGVVICKYCGTQVKSNRNLDYFDHAESCNKISEEARIGIKATRADYLDRKRTPEQQRADVFLILTMMEFKCPMRMVESQNFKNFMRSAPKGYIGPSRTHISREIIPKISAKLQSAFIASVEASSDFTWTIEFDHWRDLLRRSMLGVVATHPDGSRHLLDLEEVSLKGHSSEAIRESLLSCLSKIPANKINSVISDSASSCKKARESLSIQFDYIHIMTQRCVAHLLNLIGSRFANSTRLSSLMERANALSTFLSNDTLFIARSKQLGHPRVKTQCRTRWYADTDMLESLESLESMDRPALTYLKERIDSAKTQREREKFEAFVSTLEDASFWDDLREAIHYFRPLSNCIAVAERADGRLGEAIKAILEYSKVVCGANLSSRFGLVAVESFFAYFNVDYLGELEFGTMLAAYFLDRRYKMDYMTEDSRALVLRTAAKIAVFSGYRTSDIDTILYSEFRQFCHQRGHLSKIAGANERAREWWSKQPAPSSNPSILKTVGIRLGNLSSSSANAERLFSVLKLIQGVNRTNYSIETLTAIGRAQLSMTQDNYGDTLHELIKNLRAKEDDDSNDDEYVEALKVRKRKTTSRVNKRLRSSVLNLGEQACPANLANQGFQGSELECELRQDQVLPGSVTATQNSQRRRHDMALIGYSEFKKLVDFSKITDLKEEYDQTETNCPALLDLDQLERRFREDEEQFANLSRASSGSVIEQSFASSGSRRNSVDRTSLDIVSPSSQSRWTVASPSVPGNEADRPIQSSHGFPGIQAFPGNPVTPVNQGNPASEVAHASAEQSLVERAHCSGDEQDIA